MPVVIGETAAGKTEFAIALAEALPGGGECLCADSMQIYRGMEIGTAKPSAAERRRVPHHLLDLADPHREAFTLADWLAAAESAIPQVDRRERWPIVVGGTNLYVQSLLAGIFEGPPADPALRSSLEALDDAAIRAELLRVDPAAAARIHPRDRRRSVRAIEVFRHGGVPLSRLQTQWESSREEGLGGRARILSIERPVEVVNRRINRRVAAMIEAGWLEEVRDLLAGGPLHRQAAEAVGYRELAETLAGRMTLADAIEAIKIRTRRFAKQQRTWIRRLRARPGSIRLDAGDRPASELVAEAVDRLLRAEAPGERPGRGRAAAEGDPGTGPGDPSG